MIRRNSVQRKTTHILTPGEARALVEQPGVVPRVVSTDDMLHSWSSDILLEFALPDGRIVTYRADHESDYYGGYYVNIVWELRGEAK